MKALKSVGRALGDSSAWKKLANPTVGRGKTAWPKGSTELESIGDRFNYDEECQPSAGKIPASLKVWRERHSGTHAVITTVLIKKGGTKLEVLQAVKEAMRNIKA
ncbi:hypothetical protein CC78DRAFT_556709 [Lojkania enalia]|uniref:Uncharacterized protein n=1 Tax=Lojkania enalia TaxID=147567 RepID=A0A9P4JX84_9PLEO|nr:hypothetical protein CC78DRAFT_556709 [Didymosphaeria enalia]